MASMDVNSYYDDSTHLKAINLFEGIKNMHLASKKHWKAKASLANAVGLAMATKNLAATYNRPGYKGVSFEAISFAGHLKLNNLTVIYDNNQITCDRSADLTNTEDVNAKMQACGWDVIDVEDECYNVEGIVHVAGTAIAHGVAFGACNVTEMKKANDFDRNDSFVIGETVRNFFHDLPARGEGYVREWNELVKRTRRRISRTRRGIPASKKPTPSRVSSGLVLKPIAKKIPSFMVGTVDLSPSVNMNWPGKVDFQHPELSTTCGINGDYSGRYMHYGVREHAMCAISNGLAAFAPNTFIPVTSSFFMFYLYAAPAVHMGALQRPQLIRAATHDSIGMGEDGPTHQPIELASLYRDIRPGDSEEIAGA
ncbi:hypothetical protein IFM61606_09921 [Aspergillus udagawae]|nr:hypothetical protein IFM61606_09921 [Aspergillus udagawae]